MQRRRPRISFDKLKEQLEQFEEFKLVYDGTYTSENKFDFSGQVCKRKGQQI